MHTLTRPLLAQLCLAVELMICPEVAGFLGASQVKAESTTHFTGGHLSAFSGAWRCASAAEGHIIRVGSFAFAI